MSASTSSPSTPSTDANRELISRVERLLRRLPRVIRQLRVRQGDRPGFRVNDERDLEDLLRSLLPLLSEDVRPDCRTATYAPGSSTDFLIENNSIVLTVKRARPTTDERALARQIQEDTDYYDAELESGLLMCFIYDPEALLKNARELETTWSKSQGKLDVRCIIAG
jgi:hypothetical protein